MDFRNNRSFYVLAGMLTYAFFLFIGTEKILPENHFILPIFLPLTIGFGGTYLMGYKNITTQQDCFWVSLLSLCTVIIVFVLVKGFSEFIGITRLLQVNFIFSLLLFFVFMAIGHWFGFKAVKHKIEAGKFSDDITLDRYFNK